MSEFGVGFGYLVQGQRWILGRGRLYGFGLLPGVVTLVLYVAAFAALVVWGPDLATAMTPFADTWPSPWPGLLRAVLTVALIAIFLLVAVVAFAAVTLLIGQPFYEAISLRVDRSVSPDGSAPESESPFWRELWVSLRDSVRILVRVLLWGVLLFVLGLIPVLGQTVVPVVAIIVSGFFLTEELTAVALQRRSIPATDRLSLLRKRKRLAWGFGVPLAVIFLIPLAAVFLMPGAVAGATLMARDLLDENATDTREEPDTNTSRVDQAAGRSGSLEGVERRSADGSMRDRTTVRRN
ncbi:EI24 domain-containing protein [Nocardia callitridis]|uniref:EI24 domain-containing protein n=1 Tax=Nocardia callitridis TaxID=648753 RepID=A0ABP9KAY7_9NOCA